MLGNAGFIPQLLQVNSVVVNKSYPLISVGVCLVGAFFFPFPADFLVQANVSVIVLQQKSIKLRKGIIIVEFKSQASLMLDVSG